jgi:hypothetical protein
MTLEQVLTLILFALILNAVLICRSNVLRSRK